MLRQRLQWFVLLTLCLAGVAHAEPARPKLSSQQCGYSTPYDLRIADDGVWLERQSGAPREVHIHEGGLTIDQRAQVVSAEDAVRLRRMETMTRDLVPAVAGIARDAVDIAFDALAGVVEVMGGGKSKAKEVEKFRHQALAQIDDSLGKGRWDQKTFDDRFEANIESAAEEMASSLTHHVLWAAFTGRADEIDKRAEQMEKDLDARMEERGRSLETRAQSLCDQVTALHDLQQQLDVRYDGRPLDLLERSKDRTDKDGEGNVATTQ